MARWPLSYRVARYRIFNFENYGIRFEQLFGLIVGLRCCGGQTKKLANRPTQLFHKQSQRDTKDNYANRRQDAEIPHKFDKL